MAKQPYTLMTAIMAHPNEVAAVGQEPHVRQVQVWANVTSKAEFARLLIAARFSTYDVAGTVRNMTPYLNEPKYRPELEQGVLYLRGLNAHGDADFIRADSIPR